MSAWPRRKRSIRSLLASDPPGAHGISAGESSPLRHPELKVSTPAHIKDPGRCVDLGFRGTHRTTPPMAEERVMARARSTTSLRTCRSWPPASLRKHGSIVGASKTLPEVSVTLPTDFGYSTVGTRTNPAVPAPAANAASPDMMQHCMICMSRLPAESEEAASKWAEKTHDLTLVGQKGGTWDRIAGTHRISWAFSLSTWFSYSCFGSGTDDSVDTCHARCCPSSAPLDCACASTGKERVCPKTMKDGG